MRVIDYLCKCIIHKLQIIAILFKHNLMTYKEFQHSLTGDTQPATENPILTALWHDAKGDWEAAHNVAQSREGMPAYDHLHAYLHRVEGDTFNAGYWYRRAGVTPSNASLKQEWEQLVREELAR